MTPGEVSRIEDTLRRAYGDVLESVRRDGSSPELMPGFQPGRPGRRFGRPGFSRRLVPVAAAAAVAVIALVAGLIVPGALMIEPTESESKEEMDLFVEAMKSIAEEVEENPQTVLDAPHSTRVSRLDETAAARKPVLRWKPA